MFTAVQKIANHEEHTEVCVVLCHEWIFLCLAAAFHFLPLGKFSLSLLVHQQQFPLLVVLLFTTSAYGIRSIHFVQCQLEFQGKREQKDYDDDFYFTDDSFAQFQRCVVVGVIRTKIKTNTTDTYTYTPILLCYYIIYTRLFLFLFYFM